MELRSRSSRSRSKTPSSIEHSYQEGYVTQSIRITRSNKVRNYEENISSDTIMSPVEEEMEKKVLKTRLVTSDYSSDDGENEVSSSLQNFNNQTIENSSTTRVNGELSALKVYRQAGEYWNKYPKTDYTYSHHSKDRVEISPGVIQMPNMSRKSIRNSPITSTSPNVQFIANKACSTDSFLGTSASMQDYISETVLRPRTLFSTSPRQATNNNTLNGDDKSHQYYSSSSNRYSHTQSTTVVTRIWRYLLTWTYFLYEVQSQSTLWAMKRFYRFACWVLLMDRWLLTKTSQRINSGAEYYTERRDGGKVKKLLALCGVPLLLLGSCHLMSSSGVAFAPSQPCNQPHCTFPLQLYYNSIADLFYNALEYIKNVKSWFLLWGLVSFISNRPVAEDVLVTKDAIPNPLNFKHHSEQLNAAEIASALTQEQLYTISENIRNIINIHNIDYNNLPDKLLQDPNFIAMIAEKLNDSINIQTPNLVDTTGSLNAAHSTEEQIRKDDHDSEEDIVSKLLQNPIFLNIIQNENKQSMSNNIEKTVQNQEALIKQLQDQISNLRASFTSDNKAEFRRFEHQIKRCCQNSFIATEKYVLDIMKDIFQAPHHLNQADFSRWLRTVFVARDDLTTLLAALTANLNEKYDAMVEESGRLLMDQVALKLREHALKQVDRTDVDIDYDRITAQLRDELKTTLDDEHIKRIVRNVLAIYDADKTGLVDFALETSGAEVLSTKCTEAYQHSTAVWSVLGVPLWHMYKSPQTVLQPSVNPGECWAFQSFPGYVIIKLAHPIHIEAISYEHVNKLLIADGRIDSAPKHFSIYGLIDPDETKHEPVLLGEFVYDVNGEPLQFFTIPGNATTGETPAFGFIEWQVHTNHGNPNYTCLYRLRVHGKKAAHNPT